MATRLKVLSWNVYIGHKPEAVHNELQQMIDEHEPDVILLYEARRLFGHLDHLGYNVHQLRSKTARRGFRPGTANVAVLTRGDLKVRKTFTMYMHTFWRGPHVGARQSPRVYRWIRLQKWSVTWKIGGFHIPFGSHARGESVARIRQWFHNTMPGRPTIGFGDYNLTKTTVRSWIAKRIGAKVAGFGIDLAVYKNCRLISARNLGHHGSDHPVMLYLFEKSNLSIHPLEELKTNDYN